MSDHISKEENDEAAESLKEAIDSIPTFRLMDPDEFEAVVSEMEGLAAKREHDDREAGKRFITEEGDRETIDGWYAFAQDMDESRLPEFVRSLIHDYHHDYGTICHAIAAAAYAAARTIQNSPTGGITAFQASAVQWEFLRHWMMWSPNDMYRLVNHDDMLYPQMEYKFRTINKYTWEKLQEQAKKKLGEAAETAKLRDPSGFNPGGAHPEVLAHWQSIADGNVPFGFSVED